ncbi:hypothetical protein [Sagittula sp. S175]|uniref:hypothetical protein n=1 Tax=Sagittula sp. S175 TaxID=3415129 RepID=UPI003C7D8990
MKQAVVILHGMGEQIPMQTLNSFVDTVWTRDRSLVDKDRPDPDTGGKRTGNVSWAKPDTRNTSAELRRVTTEQDDAGNYTDFYEYYWAHMMQGNTWEHVKAWIMDLLFRRPPERVRHAWIVLWVLTLIVGGVTLWGLWPRPAPAPWVVFVSALFGIAATGFVSNVLVKRFGDVARYVKAWPANVARRKEIRETGVKLLKDLTECGDYDRIIVVAHSLGTIVAYDMLTQLFAQYNSDIGRDTGPQPQRHRLEDMIRAARDGGTLDLDAYQAQQAKVLEEARALGFKWCISDFVTLGAPLTHAEFLVADSRADLRAKQARRRLPTCPPVLEFDGTTKLHHFTYSNARGRKPEDRRVPHHAALFAYTRWTNLYAPEKAIVTGDLIAGPVGEVFGLEHEGRVIQGVRDIAVLPRLAADGSVAKGHRRSGFAHNNYWAMDKGTETDEVAVPWHIEQLRKALGLLQKR